MQNHQKRKIKKSRTQKQLIEAEIRGMEALLGTAVCPIANRDEAFDPYFQEIHQHYLLLRADLLGLMSKSALEKDVKRLRKIFCKK